MAYRLHTVGFPVLITELPHPHLVRRTVSFGSAAIDDAIVVDGISARRVDNLALALAVQSRGNLPVLIDPEGELLPSYAPTVLVDARMLKRNPGPYPVNASLMIGLGPGFDASANCDAVIETNRGHNLGRVIWRGKPEPNTGIPGQVKGQAANRVLRAPIDGTVTGLVPIGTQLEQDQPVAEVDGEVVVAPFEGVLRGLIHDGLTVEAGAKIGDVDPRNEPSYCFSISEKSLAIGGGVLEAVLSYAPIWDRIRRTP